MLFQNSVKPDKPIRYHFKTHQVRYQLDPVGRKLGKTR